MKKILIYFLLLNVTCIFGQFNYFNVRLKGTAELKNINFKETYTIYKTGGNWGTNVTYSVKIHKLYNEAGAIHNSFTVWEDAIDRIKFTTSNPLVTIINKTILQDEIGNKYYIIDLKAAPSYTENCIDVTVEFTKLDTKLNLPLDFNPSDLFPLDQTKIPDDIKTKFLGETDKVDINSTSVNFKTKAEGIIGSETNMTCIIVSLAEWIKGNIAYLENTSNIASNVLLNKVGDCDGMSHLMVAFLRSLKIPSRITNAYSMSLERSYPIWGGNKATWPGGNGSGTPTAHAYYEVYWPSINNWVAGDPAQQTANFTHEKNIPLGHGKDSEWPDLSVSISGFLAPGETQPTGISVTYQPYVVFDKTNYTNSLLYVYHDEFSGSLNKSQNILFNSNERGTTSAIYDKVKINNASTNFSPGQNVSYSATFTSGWGDTWPINWHWYMRLYHKDGIYEYKKLENTSSNWNFITDLTLPNYQWNRDPLGNIYGDVMVVVEISDGDSKADIVPISVQYKPNSPIIDILSYINSDDPLNNSLTFKIYSGGATSYKIYYSSSKIAHQGNSPISLSPSDIYTLSNLNYGDKFWITGINNYGTSNSDEMYIGKYVKIPFTYTNSGDQNLVFTQYKNDPLARIQFSSGSILLDNTSTSSYAIKAGADMHLDLNNEKQVMLEFDWRNYSDGKDDGDGIFISVDGGGSFSNIYAINPRNYAINVYHHFALNLSDLTQNIELNLSEKTIIRFGHEDYSYIPVDGFEYKNIKVYSTYTPPSSISTMTLTAEKDAELIMSLKPGYEYMANTNYGTYPMIKADEWTVSGYRTNSIGLFDFNLKMFPSNTIIKSAKLSLYANNPQPNDDYKQMSNYSAGSTTYKSNACWLYRIVDPWEENTITYNIKPRVVKQNPHYLPVSESYNQNYLNIDVSQLVEDIIKNPTNSYGLMLKLDNEIKFTRMAFASSDHTNTALHPKLTLNYFIDEPVYSIPFTLIGSTTNETNNWDVQGSDGNDKAYLVYIPSPLTIDATTCSNVTNYDTKIEIFKADKSSSGYYNDDNSCTSILRTTSSLVDVSLTPGYYYFVVDGYAGATGNFQLSVFGTPTLKNTKPDIFEDQVITDKDSEVVFYPNPVTENLIIKLQENALIRIFDIKGVLLKEIKEDKLELSIDCSDLSTGNYSLQVILSNSVESFTFQKLSK